MNLSRGRKVFVSLLLSLLILTTACGSAKKPSQFDQAQQDSTRQSKGLAVAKNATQGSDLNKFFPASGDGYNRVYTQEKKGFSEANLKKDGKVIAQLAVSDTTSLPGAASKFAKSTKKIGGYPALEIGNTQTSVLVGKFQVKVLSKAPTFGPSDRANWIQKFNLDGLSKLR
jgi:hypothetical protein